ncbi:MAG: hypothetical protein PWQ82_1564 [Thermosediminibacterales bacterium]|nr:hypothetical protein [Thermosediminibacterales bacterium]MDK2835791.1 hypothetical protein [Thermosediminibacterales bacterium]
MSVFVSIQLDKSKDEPLYIQLYLQLRQMIEQGRLKPDEKLPPIRKLSEQLKINSVTVVNAYKLLEQHGYVYSRVGSGTYISDNLHNQLHQLEPPETEPFREEEFRLMDQGQIHIRSNTINFASATPTPELFPVEDFKNVLNEVLDRDGGFAFGYQESQGFFPLRESITAYLRYYGIEKTPECIQIISGAQQGIDVLAKALLNFGDCLVVESPTYTGAIAAFRSRGAKIIEVPIEKDGINLEVLEKKLKKFHPKFIYVMPNFQNPTGYCYSLKKRKALLQLAKQYDTLIIEDDYLSELNFSRKKLAPLKAIDHYNKVVYIKSFSKIFMPGLRLAFLVLPEQIYNDVLAAKHTSDISTSGLTQRAFDLYLRKGIWQKHIQYMQKIYKERYKVMSEALENFMPKEIDYHLPEGGLTFWLALPEGCSSNKLYLECREKDVVFVPGSVFYSTQKDSRYFRLSFAAVYPEEIKKGIRILGNTINHLLKNNTKNKKGTNYYTPLL